MRYITEFIKKDLLKKMVLLGGPRQSGKTTLAKGLCSSKSRYFLWDDELDRKSILRRDWSDENDLIIFDELHKFKRWRNWIKGIFDKQRALHQFLITGSARLDLYRRGGDSLLGRFHYWRLHPFTLSEIPGGISDEEAFRRLLMVGGFPEPFLDGNETEARRWRRERLDRVLKDDIRDLESIKDIQTLDLLVGLLRERVGKIIVVSNLAQDLQVESRTILRWIQALERMYLVFVVRSWSRATPRTLQKPFKVYFFDTGDVIGDEAAKFENLVACHILKWIHFQEDREGYRYELYFLRDKEKREVDFCILKEKYVVTLIEAKWADANPTPALHYFAERLQPTRAIQVVAHLKDSTKRGKLEVRNPFEVFTKL